MHSDSKARIIGTSQGVVGAPRVRHSKTKQLVDPQSPILSEKADRQWIEHFKRRALRAETALGFLLERYPHADSLEELVKLMGSRMPPHLRSKD